MMFNELVPLLGEHKANDLLQRLENKRVEQALPAEMELVLLWGLRQLGDIEVEPNWLGNGRLPDAYSKMLFPGQPTLIEIAAVSDAGLAQEDEMRRTASLLCEAANIARRGCGRHLHFQFGEESEWTSKGYVRRRKVDPEFAVTDDIAKQLAVWLEVPSGTTRVPFRIRTEKTELMVTWHDQKQSQHSNFFSSMPAEAYSLTDNPLHSILKDKAAQLNNEEFAGIRCLLLCDAGSRLLRDLTDGIKSHGAYSGAQIIEAFLAHRSCNLDVVCVFSPCRAGNVTAFPSRSLTWRTHTFLRRGIQVPEERLRDLASVLPAPRFEGSQARSLQRQAAYAVKSRGWYIGTNILSGKTKMTVSISARALLDLLAGRINTEQFNYFTGMDSSPNKLNIFKLCLERGEVISNIKIESGGLDEDDDRLVVEFSKDPSASRLSRNMPISERTNDP